MSLKKTIQTFLAMLMLLGNPALWLDLAFSSQVRIGLTAFLGSMLLSGRVMARNLSPDNKVVDLTQAPFSADPSDAELGQLRFLDAPLVPTSGNVQSGENADLSKALKAVLADRSEETLQPLEDFATSHPQSRWVTAVELNRGLILYDRGYFSVALVCFQKAWDAGKNDTGSKAKGLADRALSEMILLNCKVGRKETAEALAAQMGPRKPQGQAARIYERTLGAFWAMENQPGKSFFCGPFALQNILKFEKSPKANDPLFETTQSPSTGFSLAQLRDLSDELAMGYQMAKRKPGAPVIVPSVVNWKLNHYAALVEKKNTPQGVMVHIVDPTFNNDSWLSEKALDEESSGYFLIPAGSLPEGWQAVNDEEGATVWGKGNPGYYSPQGAGCPTSPDNSCSTCAHMPRASIYLPLAIGQVKDTPVGYQPPVGPAMNFTLNYNQETFCSLPYTNFGSNWSFNWQGFIQYSYSSGSMGSSIIVSSPNGGDDPVTGIGGYTKYLNALFQAPQSFTSGPVTGLPSSFTKQMPDGSVEVYGQTFVGLSTVQSLLTEIIDAQGQTVSLNYDSLGRISSITDAIGQNTLFTYGSAGYPMQPTRITDPFGRSAAFTYDADGFLQSITDTLNLTTSFTYNGSAALSTDWVNSMTTPYGTTSFNYAGSAPTTTAVGTNELDLTDPMGLREHVTLTQNVTPRDGTTPGNPSGTLGSDAYNNYRDVFYWNKTAMADDPLDVNSATVYHWLHTYTGGQSLTLESLEKPLESRVWYVYPTQTVQYVESNDVMPTTPIVITRYLNNSSSSQEYQYTYNFFGQKLTSVDPVGRSVTYTYAANNIDLLSTGTADGVLSSATYNSQHEPLSTTDAAGQVTSYSYNSAGQVLTTTTPQGETTHYNYNFQGYLTSVVPPQPGSAVTYSYDYAGRIQSKSDAVDGTITYQYDNGNRLVKTSYPDGTYEENTYTKLDLTSHRDRQGRVTTYAYDADERMTSMTDPKLQTTNYGWCACGSMTSITDPKGNRTNFTYDLEGRLTNKSYMDGSSYSYTYDSTGGSDVYGVGNLVSAEDPKDQTTSYTYNADKTISNLSYTNAQNPTPNVSYSYDSVLPRMTSMTDGTGTTSYTYGTLGNVGGNLFKTVVSPVGSSAATISYAYDADGRTVVRSIGSAFESYAYTNTELTNVTNPLGSFTYSYDPNSARLVNVSYPNGQATTMTYFSPTNPLGASGSLETITNNGGGTTTGQVLSKFSYTYTPAGDISTWAQQLGNSTTLTNNYQMGYDADSELMAVTLTSGNTNAFDSLTAGQAVTYAYDAAGNRTAEGAPTYLNTFGTNNLNQLTNITPKPIPIQGYTNRAAAVTVNGTVVTENSNFCYQTTIPQVSGNSTPLTVTEAGSDGSVNYIKNHVLNTVPYVYDANGNLSTDQTYRYQWDAKNELVGISWINPQPPSMTDNITFTYDGERHCVGIVESHGSTVLTSKTFVWCQNKLSEERDSTGHTVTNRYLIGGEQIVSGSNAGNYYFTTDHLNNIREMIDSSGNIQAQYDYDPWGRATKLKGNLDADFGYADYYVNQSSGLYLTMYRAYDSNKGRWLSRDPKGEKAGLNLYAYVSNKPLVFNDPLGLDSNCPGCILPLWGPSDCGYCHFVPSKKNPCCKNECWYQVMAYANNDYGRGPAYPGTAIKQFGGGLFLTQYFCSYGSSCGNHWEDITINGAPNQDAGKVCKNYGKNSLGLKFCDN